MNKKYLVTGGMGLIGSNLSNRLKGDVTIVSRSKTNEARIKRKVKVIIKSINELSIADIKGIDIIYHCASTVDNYNILTDPYLDVRTNVEGTIHLLELIKDLKKKPKIVYLSTFFVYGHEYDRSRKPLTEESPTEPLSLYPATKLTAENVIKIYSRLYGIPYVIFRLTNVYGEEEQYGNKKKGALNFLIMEALKGNDLTIYGGGNFIRDYIYVDDVARAIIRGSREKNQTYLVGYGKSIAFSKLISIIHKETGGRSKVVAIPIPDFHKAVGINNMAVNTKKIRSLGWTPKVSFEEGAKKIVTRYRSRLRYSHGKI